VLHEVCDNIFSQARGLMFRKKSKPLLFIFKNAKKRGLFNIPFTVVERDALNPVTATLDSDLPVTTNNYEGLWHTADFTINLTATDNTSGIAETFYKNKRRNDKSREG
jgi:hypothetical protein